MTSDRRAALIKRAGVDPVRVDPRPLSEILQDEIPYLRWSKEAQVIVRAGYKSWAQLLQDRYNAKSKKRS